MAYSCPRMGLCVQVNYLALLNVTCVKSLLYHCIGVFAKMGLPANQLNMPEPCLFWADAASIGPELA